MKEFIYRLFELKRYFIIFWSGFSKYNNNGGILGVNVVETKNGKFPTKLKLVNNFRKNTNFSSVIIQNIIELSKKEAKEWEQRNML